MPELVKLLDDPDRKVRFRAVKCLTHTLENEDRPGWEQYEKHEGEELAKWRTWWKEHGAAFVAGEKGVTSHSRPRKDGS